MQAVNRCINTVSWEDDTLYFYDEKKLNEELKDLSPYLAKKIKKFAKVVYDPFYRVDHDVCQEATNMFSEVLKIQEKQAYFSVTGKLLLNAITSEFMYNRPLISEIAKAKEMPSSRQYFNNKRNDPDAALYKDHAIKRHMYIHYPEGAVKAHFANVSYVPAELDVDLFEDFKKYEAFESELLEIHKISEDAVMRIVNSIQLKAEELIQKLLDDSYDESFFKTATGSFLIRTRDNTRLYTFAETADIFNYFGRDYSQMALNTFVKQGKSKDFSDNYVEFGGVAYLRECDIYDYVMRNYLGNPHHNAERDGYTFSDIQEEIKRQTGMELSLNTIRAYNKKSGKYPPILHGKGVKRIDKALVFPKEAVNELLKHRGLKEI